MPKKNEYSKLSKHDGRKKQNKKTTKLAKQKPTTEVRAKPPSNISKAKKDRVSQYSLRAARKIFGSEAEVWMHLAEKAKEGSFAHLQLFMNYAYGTAKDRQIDTGQKKSNAPVINFYGMDKPKEIDLDNVDDAEIIDED